MGLTERNFEALQSSYWDAPMLSGNRERLHTLYSVDFCGASEFMDGIRSEAD